MRSIGPFCRLCTCHFRWPPHASKRAIRCRKPPTGPVCGKRPKQGGCIALGSSTVRCRCRNAGRGRGHTEGSADPEIGFVWLCSPRSERFVDFRKSFSGSGLRSFRLFANWVCFAEQRSRLLARFPPGPSPRARPVPRLFLSLPESRQARSREELALESIGDGKKRSRPRKLGLFCIKGMPASRLSLTHRHATPSRQRQLKLSNSGFAILSRFPILLVCLLSITS